MLIFVLINQFTPIWVFAWKFSKHLTTLKSLSFFLHIFLSSAYLGIIFIIIVCHGLGPLSLLRFLPFASQVGLTFTLLLPRFLSIFSFLYPTFSFSLLVSNNRFFRQRHSNWQLIKSFLKNGPFAASFLYFRPFSTADNAC